MSTRRRPPTPHEEPRHRRSTGAGRTALGLILALSVLMGCEEVLVNAIPVQVVRVVPDTADLFEGQSIQLAADLRDDADEPLSGREVTWTTDDSTVAVVDPQGLVLATGPGTAAITATAEGQTGGARIVIRRRPFIDVEQAEISLVYTQGDTAAAPIRVAITNGGGGALTGLTASVDYEMGIGGWLDVELAGTETPTTLTLTVFPPSLEIGDYAAVVWIADLGASNSPVRVDVGLRIRENVPARPAGLRVEAVEADGVRLAWTDSSDNEDEFRIERAIPTDTFEILAVVAAGVDAYTDGTVVADSDYRYRVSACNTAGCSAPSDPAAVVTFPAPARDLAVTPRSASELRLDWTDGSRTETEFRIERRSGSVSFRDVATVGANVTTYRDTGLEPATRYEYRVTACNPSGCAEPTDVASGITTDVPPATPIAVSATTVSASRITVSWTDASDNETGFRIERAAGGSYSGIATVGAGQTSYDDTSVTVDTEYSYRVASCNDAGCSSPSAPDTAVTPPRVPTAVTATAVSDTRIDVTWTDGSTTETAFRVERRTGTAAFQEVAATPANATAHTSSGLAPGTAYDFRIRACNDGGCSTYSATATATTRATPPPADPTALAATLAEDGSRVALEWTDNAATESGFRVHRRVGAGTYTVLDTVPANTTVYTDTALQADATHTYRVDACSDAGCSGFTNEAAITTAPLAPSALAASVVSATRIDLTWTDNSATENAFRIERSVDGGAFTLLATVDADIVAFRDETTTADTRYAYRLAACNDGGCSPYSTEASATTPPTAPTGLTATAVAADRIDLGWTDTSDTETGFRIQRSANGGVFTTLATVGVGVTGYQDTTVALDTGYAYRVAACNAGGCSPYSSESLAATLPTAPSGLTATAAADTVIDLTWTDNSATETSFRIERRTGADPFQRVASVAGNLTAYRDAGLEPATSYDYRVLACSAAGCSSPSGTASATTATVPPPSGLTATVVSTSQVDLAWTDNATTETGFRIERSVDGGAFELLTTVLTDVTTYSDRSVQADTEYSYRVAACNGTLCSTFAGPADVVTAPVAPSGLTAVAASDTSIALSWTDNSSTETELRIERRTGTAAFTQVATVGANTGTFTDPGLEPATTYDYRVRACNPTGCSGPSDPASATTDPIPAPAGLTATLVAASQIDLAWTDNSTRETGFRIERSVNGGTFSALATVPEDTTTYSDTAIQGDTEYAYRVAACNATTCSAYSNVATVATPPVAPTNLTTATVSDTEIDLAWTDNSVTETEFRIERRIQGGFSLVATVGTDVTTYRDSGLAPLTSYDYRVSACNASGCSGTTPPTPGTTDSIPAPGDFSATAISAGQVDLTWSDASSEAETEFRIERSVEGSAFSVLATIAADLTAYSDGTTTEGTAYDYRIRACGVSTCSSSSTAAGDTTPPIAPSGLAATAQSAGQVDLTWTDNSGVETGFRIERSTDGGSSFTVLDGVGSDVATYSDLSTVEGTEYVYRVQSCSATRCSPYSNQATATTPAATSG
ncbi:MAG: fibronectin type III domain-containing protein [Candidatus Longimicrobiales bacterium M2_2A_002]